LQSASQDNHMTQPNYTTTRTAADFPEADATLQSRDNISIC